MHKRGARWPSLLLAGIAHALELIAARLAGCIRDIRFTKVMFARIEIVATKRAEQDEFLGVN